MIAGERSRRGEGLKMTRCNTTGGVKCSHMEENAAALVKMRSSCEFRNRPPLFIEMKHVVLRKGGMHLEEKSCSPNSSRMGNTSKKVSTSVC